MKWINIALFAVIIFLMLRNPPGVQTETHRDTTIVIMYDTIPVLDTVWTHIKNDTTFQLIDTLIKDYPIGIGKINAYQKSLDLDNFKIDMLIFVKGEIVSMDYSYTDLRPHIIKTVQITTQKAEIKSRIYAGLDLDYQSIGLSAELIRPKASYRVGYDLGRSTIRIGVSKRLF